MGKTFKAFALANVALALFSAQAWAASDLATASVSLSRLTYELIDLDPNDSVAPTVTFKTPGGSSVWEFTRKNFDPTFQSQVDQPTALYNRSGSIDFTHASGKASFGAGGVSLQSNYSVDQAKAIIDTVPVAERGNSATFEQQLDLLGGKEFSFTLGAHTAIVFKGQASISTSLNETTVQTALTGLLPAHGSLTLASRASAYVKGGWDNNFPDGRDNERSWGIGSVASSEVSSSAINSIYTPLTSVNDPFQIVFTNDGFSSMDASVNVGLEVRQSLTINPPPNPAIPEPASYLMWALGLAGLACVSRKHLITPILV